MSIYIYHVILCHEHNHNIHLYRQGLEEGLESDEAIKMQQLVAQYQQVKHKLAQERARGHNAGAEAGSIAQTEAEMTSIKTMILELKKRKQEADLEQRQTSPFNSSPSIYTGNPPLRFVLFCCCVPCECLLICL
jgi:ATPase subunit of ABC transporter with duplicated ATPase domains